MALGLAPGPAVGAPVEPPTRPLTLVTGGSEGIGLAIAERFAARGHHLLIVARTAARLAGASDRLQASGAASVATLALDLTSPSALAEIDRRLAGLGAHVEVLVNNAGIGLSGPLAEADPAALEQLIALNMAVPARLMRHLLPAMRRRGHGGVLNIASLGAYVPGPNQAAYYASKAFLVSLSEAVSREVRRDGVTVTVVAPGPVATAFHARMGAEAALYRWLIPAVSPGWVAAWSVRGFDLGLRVVVPGFLNLLSYLALRVLPHVLIVPAVAILLDPRSPRGKGDQTDV